MIHARLDSQMDKKKILRQAERSIYKRKKIPKR